MKTKYICLNCGHMFDVCGKTNEPHKFGACPECGSDNYLEDDLDIVDNLRDWLDPWHPASEPPEKFKSGVLYSRNVEVQSATGKVYTTWYDYNLKDFADVSNTIRWRDLPPMPEVKS